MPDTRPLQWSAEQLWQTLEPLLPGLSVEVVARCESTNTVLIERARSSGGRRDTPITGPGELDVLAEPPDNPADPMPFGRRAGDTHPCLLVAEHQTRGRGRMGRLWQSSPGASLTFSLGVAMAPRDWSGMSLAIGVALAEALDPALSPAPGALRIGLKWPNDLWLMDGVGPGRKLGGVLIETVAVGQRRMVVIGVGLNVTPQSTRELSSGFACLRELDTQVVAPAALRLVARPLIDALQRFEADGFAPFSDRFAGRDVLLGHDIVTTSPACPDGVADGIAPDGALRIRTADGSHCLLSSGEVSVRLLAGGPASDEPQAEPDTR